MRELRGMFFGVDHSNGDLFVDGVLNRQTPKLQRAEVGVIQNMRCRTGASRAPAFQQIRREFLTLFATMPLMIEIKTHAQVVDVDVKIAVRIFLKKIVLQLTPPIHHRLRVVIPIHDLADRC